MQNNVLMAVALCGCGFSMKAQQENAKVRYISHKTGCVHSINCAKHCSTEKTMVEVTKTAVCIVEGNKPVLTGSVNNVSCVWKEAFAKGKTIIDTTLTDIQGALKEATITIEGADGTITILLEEKACPGIITRLVVERHEEVN